DVRPRHANLLLLGGVGALEECAALGGDHDRRDRRQREQKTAEPHDRCPPSIMLSEAPRRRRARAARTPEPTKRAATPKDAVLLPGWIEQIPSGSGSSHVPLNPLRGSVLHMTPFPSG